MKENDKEVQKIEWCYQHPSKKDRTLIYKLLQAYLITMGFIVAVLIWMGFGMRFQAPLELLKIFGILGGFLTVVMVLCYPLTILFIRIIGFYISIPMKLVALTLGENKKDNKEEKKEEKKSTGKTIYIAYRFMADDEKIHSWSVVETKGGKHIRYHSVRRLVSYKTKNRIEVRTLLGRTFVYATDEDYDTVWAFLSTHCTEAKIMEET